MFAPWPGLDPGTPLLSSHADPSTHRPKGGNKRKGKCAALEPALTVAWHATKTGWKK